MLRIVEFSLLAVSLLVVVGLIVTNSRNGSESSGAPPPAITTDTPEAQKPGKSV